MRKGTVCILAGLALLLAAAGLAGYNLWDAARADRASEAILAELSIPEPDPEAIPDYQLDPGREMPAETIDGWDCVGVLSIPALGLELPVIGEWSYPALRQAPCRYTGSAYTDDMTIAAHNYARHFGHLTALRPGDAVTFTDLSGNVFRYAVAETETLQPTDIQEMTAGDWPLTLFTCTKGGQYRVTVRCEKSEYGSARGVSPGRFFAFWAGNFRDLRKIPPKKPQPPSTPAVDGGYCQVSFCMGFFLLSLASVLRKGHGFQSMKHQGHRAVSTRAILFRTCFVFGAMRFLGNEERVVTTEGGSLGSHVLSVSKRYNIPRKKSRHLMQNQQFT